jgi:hypothetical protein
MNMFGYITYPIQVNNIISNRNKIKYTEIKHETKQ